MESKKISNTGIINLTVAIVKSVADDYRKALKNNQKQKIKDLEKWFTSEYGELLCNGKGEYIMNTIRNEFRKE